MKVGRLLLRAAVGGFFVGHGTQKLMGWFDGHGLDSTAQMFEGLGLRPGKVHATAAGLAETAGGAGLLLGAETPFAASAVTATMLTAINRVHLKNGPWISSGGYEYNAVLIAAALTLAEIGPGPLSVDALRGRERSGDKWALVALVLGAAGAVGAHLFASSRQPVAEAAASVPAPSAPAPEVAPLASAPTPDPAPGAESPVSPEPDAAVTDGGAEDNVSE
jgi:putative oxidoreductase